MISKEILKKVRQIEISTRGLVNEIFSGEYHSIFKGLGMEFSEVREYQYGDDIRSIDWNVSARIGHPYVKVFEEERELNVMLLVDASSSGNFGTQLLMKGEIAAEICALLAFSAVKNNDKVGLIIFTDQIEKFVPPKKGRTHVLRVIREILYYQAKSKKTDIGLALEYLNRVVRRRSVVFLVSDLISPKNYEKPLRVLNKKHDIIALNIIDPREEVLPNIGYIELEDAETGERVLVDTSDTNIRNEFFQTNLNNKNRRNEFFRKINVDTIEIKTNESYVENLIRFFRMRAKRFR